VVGNGVSIHGVKEIAKVTSHRITSGYEAARKIDWV